MSVSAVSLLVVTGSVDDPVVGLVSIESVVGWVVTPKVGPAVLDCGLPLVDPDTVNGRDFIVLVLEVGVVGVVGPVVGAVVVGDAVGGGLDDEVGVGDGAGAGVGVGVGVTAQAP